MRRKSKKAVAGAVRNPDRTRSRILAAAAAEFAAKGQAGARVDAIARRAGTNKRMLYHYFSDKGGLYRAVLRAKITERRTLFEAAPGDPAENLPFRFEMMCRDLEWIRLLGWEALEYKGGRVNEEEFRRKGLHRALERLRGHQAAGRLTSAYDRRHLLLAKISLSMFPVAFPHMTKLVTGMTAQDPKFQREYRKFLKKFATVFRPARPHGKLRSDPI
ncbi:MAG TPA: TetR/AcrR family transcriptional regulator [Candidatus Acidoferrales bacterium]|jgi:TetR/AcrR family transcriptional regulator|nr:TetR/AcrR family transcriptional regulator [Candidatus Acidoferrales bacterium]